MPEHHNGRRAWLKPLPLRRVLPAEGPAASTDAEDEAAGTIEREAAAIEREVGWGGKENRAEESALQVEGRNVAGEVRPLLPPRLSATITPPWTQSQWADGNRAAP